MAAKTLLGTLVVVLLALAYLAGKKGPWANDQVSSPQQGRVDAAGVDLPVPPHDAGTPGQPERIVVETVETGDLVAPTASAPTLTYRGHLIEFVQRGLPDLAEGASMVGEPSIDTVVRDPRLNPNGKQPNDAQLDAMRELLRGFAEPLAALRKENQSLTRKALTQAVERDQFVAKEQLAIGSADPQEFLRQHRALVEQGKRDQVETMQFLTDRLGRSGKDWSYSLCGTTEPDGVTRNTVVYFTRADAPEVFACRDEMSELNLRRREALRQFFAGM